ncbi:hypothetical protein P2G88_00095 [Aliiglaciecola sp. CAU 1673]|uniref:hypothetical protein n=1 Tax=Aliiglaciecola sp. CAU 1673 TaxID=3032595 RepID=UPI0023DB91AB|nr:hypothetical protein [Aliiglaciecola sp. CAU 1673]MDF2176646.1 hypothetical protein [Aliiglaciecola sp. CAU 1673]
MANFSLVRDLLTHNLKLHQQAAAFYKGLSEKTQSERVRMFLNTLALHEQQLAKELKSYVEGAPDKVLNTYFQYDPGGDTSELFTAPFDPGQCNESDVESLANKLDDYFCELYKDMVTSASIAAVKELFENLYDHLVEEKKRLSTDIYSLEDM